MNMESSNGNAMADDEPKTLRVVHCRAMVLSYCIVDGVTHECVLTYQVEAPDDDREMWRGIGITHQFAAEAALRAYFKWRDATDPDHTVGLNS